RGRSIGTASLSDGHGCRNFRCARDPNRDKRTPTIGRLGIHGSPCMSGRSRRSLLRQSGIQRSHFGTRHQLHSILIPSNNQSETVKTPQAILSAALLAAMFSSDVAAQGPGRTPGSVLFYPIHRSGPAYFTVVAVTNTNTQPKTLATYGGSTN